MSLLFSLTAAFIIINPENKISLPSSFCCSKEIITLFSSSNAAISYIKYQENYADAFINNFKNLSNLYSVTRNNDYISLTLATISLGDLLISEGEGEIIIKQLGQKLHASDDNIHEATALFYLIRTLHHKDSLYVKECINNVKKFYSTTNSDLIITNQILKQSHSLSEITPLISNYNDTIKILSYMFAFYQYGYNEIEMGSINRILPESLRAAFFEFFCMTM